MATYKVIQDIEAEDKFLGPLTLKQFVFGMGGLFFGYLNVFAVTRGFPYATIIFTPPMILGIFLAVPWSKDQPTEVWVLAKLRFYFKPRTRVWDQSGMEELVTITAPKKEEKPLTDNLSQTEVKSRLQILAETIDSRGWAIKDAQMKNLVYPSDTQDRLISPSTLPKEVPIVDLATIPDVYDVNEAKTGNFDQMIQQSSDIRMAQNLDTMDKVRHGEPIETSDFFQPHFTPPTTDYQTFSSQQPVGSPSNDADEQALAEELKNRKLPSSFATSRMRTINPIDPNAPYEPRNYNNGFYDAQKSDNKIAEETIPPPPTPAILELAGNNDLDVATIARQAKREIDDNPNEVVISLH